MKHKHPLHSISLTSYRRFTVIPDKVWFEEALKEQAKEELGDDFEFYTEEETFWVDFLKEPPDATGDEPDDFDFGAPKIYEEIPSWGFLKEKLFGKLWHNTKVWWPLVYGAYVTAILQNDQIARHFAPLKIEHTELLIQHIKSSFSTRHKNEKKSLLDICE